MPKRQRRAPAPPLAELPERAQDRNAAIRAAHATGAYSYCEIGTFLGLHFASIGKIGRNAAQWGCQDRADPNGATAPWDAWPLRADRGRDGV